LWIFSFVYDAEALLEMPLFLGYFRI